MGTFFVSFESQALQAGLLLFQSSIPFSQREKCVGGGVVLLVDLRLDVGDNQRVRFKNQQFEPSDGC